MKPKLGHLKMRVITIWCFFTLCVLSICKFDVYNWFGGKFKSENNFLNFGLYVHLYNWIGSVFYFRSDYTLTSYRVNYISSLIGTYYKSELSLGIYIHIGGRQVIVSVGGGRRAEECMYVQHSHFRSWRSKWVWHDLSFNALDRCDAAVGTGLDKWVLL